MSQLPPKPNPYGAPQGHDGLPPHGSDGLPPHGSDGLPPHGGAPPTKDEQTWAMLAHLSPLVLGFLGPLIIWQMKKDESHFVAENAKEALNFSLAVMIVAMILAATVIGICVAPAIPVVAIIYGLIGGMDANKGILYRYPYTIRMIN